MNILDDKPSMESLRSAIAAADDSAGNHVLWVDSAGQVHLDVLPEEMSPVDFQHSQPTMRARLPTLGQDNGYTGAAAAQDEEWMGSLYRTLISLHIGADRVIYVDRFA